MINEERIVELWSEAIKDIDSHDGETIRFARAVEREVLEQAAKVAWNHYMDACRAQILNPAEHEQWLCAAAIRRLKEKA